MELLDKLTILADAAKYDAACTSSGLDRTSRPGGLGSTMAAGCCHSFSADGRCGGAEGNFGLNNMVAGSLRVAFRVQERQDSILLVHPNYLKVQVLRPYLNNQQSM